jgi:cytoskeletal protein CcmA (bactofilin family)
MDMKISGSGHIAAGEYENISVSGSAKLGGFIRCLSLHCSGSAHCEGDLEAQKNVKVSGSAHFDQNVSAQDIGISGSARIGGNCMVSGDFRISGSLRCDGDIKGNNITASGSVHTSNMESEDVQITGKIGCPGLLNAENIVIKMDGASSEIGSIGGSKISIFPERHTKKVSRLPLLSKLLGRNGRNVLTVRESIEGDEIGLEAVTAQRVVGRVVAIGEGCHIDLVQYSETVEISPDAYVGRQERI